MLLFKTMIGLVCGAAIVAGESSWSGRASLRLSEFVTLHMAQQNTPGVAIALTTREGLSGVFVFGFSELASRTPLRKDTLFEIGSIGKTFTAVGVLQLLDAGRIDLDAPLSKYMPWFRVRSRYPPFTIHHLLTHSAGLTANRDDLPSSLYQAAELRDRWTGFAPGTQFSYSNTGYQVLGQLIEEVAGQSYGAFLRERIFQPLEMTHAEPAITSSIRSRLAVGYRSIFDDRPSHPSQPLAAAPWVDWASGDASIAASPADLAAFLRMLLNHGTGPHGRVLSERAFQLMTRPAIRVREGRHYGYGISIRQANGHARIEHSGGMAGYSAMMMGDLDAGLGAVVCMNGPGDARLVAEFALQVLRSVTQANDMPVVPEPSDHIEGAAAYAGVYTSNAGKRLNVIADAGRLLLRHRGRDVVLERRYDDWFYANDPDFDTFLIGFHRDAFGALEAFHGSDWFRGARYRGPAAVRSPVEWDAYPGQYRSHNPWFPAFRVVLRKGRLWFVDPGSSEKPLAPIGHGLFQIGEANTAERLYFDTIVRGQAQRANLSGAAYYRAAVQIQ